MLLWQPMPTAVAVFFFCMVMVVTFLPTLCVSTSTPVLQGYDVVAYFSLKEGGTGVMGSSRYSAKLETSDLSNSTTPMPTQNFTFWFQNEDNMNAFKADPWR